MTTYNVIDNTYATSGLPSLNAGDYVIQLQNTLITGGGSAAMQSASTSSITLILNGMITGSRGVDVGAGSRMSIGETGHIASYNLYAIGLTGSGTINNHGLVEHISGGTAIYLTGSVNGDYVRLSNSGSIEGLISASQFSIGDQLSITNTGMISATGSALSLNEESDFVVNLGTIVGDVSLSGGADTFDSTDGTFVGSLDAGAGNDTLQGSVKADNFSGGADNDTLRGGAGADFLDGGADIDTLDYRTSSGGLAVNILTNTASGGHAQGDTIVGFENVSGSDYSDTITGNGGSNSLLGYRGNDKIAGGGGADYITGDEGNDSINGGAGADSMYGGTGNDTYFVDNVGDVVSEGAASGLDAVKSSVSFSLGTNVENVTLTGSAAIDATGNSSANIITGNSGRNILKGGGGADTFVFNTKLVSAKYDSVTDFNSNDLFDLDNSVFSGLKAGALGSTAFKAVSSGTSTAGVDGNDRILYDKSHGDLYFDRDGSGTLYSRVKFASVTDNLALGYSDFFVI